MLNKPTVFVLGAGASKAYGFPTGGELQDQIVSALRDPSDTLSQALLQYTPFDLNAIEEFWQALKSSQDKSVDAYIDRQHRFEPIGKAVMAASLITYEDPSIFDLVTPTAMPGRWYPELFSHFQPREYPVPEWLKIITYNFDRSFEYALFNHRGRNAKLVADLRGRSVWHLNGTLGIPHFEDAMDGQRDFDTSLTKETIDVAARGIRTISEVDRHASPFLEHQCALAGAKIVCFLGFGFHAANMVRLLGDWRRMTDAHIIASALGLSKDDKDRARAQLSKFSSKKPEFHDEDALWVLKNTSIFD
jgi:hypothetical protein